MAEEHDVVRLRKRPDFVPGGQEVLSLRHNPAFVPRAAQAGGTLSLSRRNHHAIMFRRLHPDSVVREIAFPASCAMCFHQEDIGEVLEDGRWWWRCPECGYKWDPIKAVE